MRYAAKWPQYARWWDQMKINASRVHEFEELAHYALAHKSTYTSIEAKTGVPWALISVLHRREGDGDFHTYLGNGQSLSRRTTIVPRGRGPFLGPDAFLDGAIDALKMDGLTSVQDWRLEKELYYTEIFNGGGYDARGLPSPYVWGGTSVQRAGKYVSDGNFAPRVWDTQPGTAPLFATLARLDPSITFVRETT